MLLHSSSQTLACIVFSTQLTNTQSPCMTHLFTNMFASSSSVWPPAYPQVSQYPPGTGGVSIYQPLQYSSSSLSSVAPPAPPPAEPPGFLSHYTQPIPSQPTPPAYPGQPPVSQCLSSSPPSHTPFFPTSSSSYSAPPSSGASFQHGGPGSPVSYMPPPPQCGVSGTQYSSKPGLKQAAQRTGPHASLINFLLLVLTN